MMDRDDIALIKREVLASSIKRRGRLAAISEYIGFVVTKLTGFGAIITGALEMLNPNFHPITSIPPEGVLAFGLALLSGSKVISLIAKVTNALK